ncbi:Two-component system histidine kinase RacS [hydrothermal vent metagenome]|uniref:histidine kinase n=1 Tax=hydrothermal vent metagenome TaxID=652676 RepID=A0A1W1ELG0_9ZZZZ
MITFYSIRSKITMIFIISIMLLLVVAYNMFNTNIISQKRGILMQEKVSISYIFQYYLQAHKIDLAFLKSQNFRLIDNPQEKRDTINRMTKLEIDKGFKILKFNRKRVIFLRYDDNIFLFENMNQIKPPNDILLIFLSLLGVLLFLYIMIINSLKPLSILKDKIYTFSQGNLDIECRSDRKDEIAQVANEFDSAVKKIKELKSSRQLLLRAIMHELKTPIAKGRLVSEMIKDKKQKARLHSIFERLNLLIDEFAKIEQLSSKNLQLNSKEYRMSDIIDAGVDMLMLENSKNHIQINIINDYLVIGDFELLSLAIKNLLDNSIKYSIDKLVIVDINNKVIIKNRGEKLNGNFQDYFVPFRTESQGLGLGLYIIKNILDIHKLEFEYRYIDGFNEMIVGS